jgi:autotransporter strand-loop-strand O-heptosyltransferase
VEYDEKISIDYVFNKSIQGGYAEQLGFENPPYIRPVVLIPELLRPIKNKYIALGVHSTCQIKYWNHPNGFVSQGDSTNWNELSAILRKRGYTPVTVEKDETYGVPPFYNGVPSKSNKQIGKTLLDAVNIINHSEFYIGLSSGMSWVAHALGKKVVMISNFTEDWNEFDLSLDDYIRITNKSVCHGCWNKINVEHTFDKNDWYWCPLHKDTERQFECHKSITVNNVMEKIENWL